MRQFFSQIKGKILGGLAIWAEFRPRRAVSLKNNWQHWTRGWCHWWLTARKNYQRPFWKQNWDLYGLWKMQMVTRIGVNLSLEISQVGRSLLKIFEKHNNKLFCEVKIIYDVEYRFIIYFNLNWFMSLLQL